MQSLSTKVHAPIKLIQVGDRHFVYDCGINNIFETDERNAAILNQHFTQSPGVQRVDQFEELEKEDQERIAYINQLIEEKRFKKPFQITYPDASTTSIVPRSIEFIISGACNMNCSYCATVNRYLNEKGKNDVMKKEVALKVVEYLRQFEIQEQTTLKFFGGEPLLGIEVIRLILQRLKAYGIKSENIIATNGTLLNESIIDFLAENKFLTFISLDGPPEIHNAYRKFHDGSTTYDTVVEKLNLIKARHPEFFKSYVAINLVNTPRFSGKYREQIDHLLALGISVKQIHAMDTSPTDNLSTHYSEEQALNVQKEKSRLRDEMVNNTLASNLWEAWDCDETYCNFYPEAIYSSGSGLDGDWVQVGYDDFIRLRDCLSYAWDILTVYPDGKVSSCIEFDRRGKTVFGDITKDHFDLAKVADFKKAFRKSVAEGPCADCWALRFCPSTGCPVKFARNDCRPDWQDQLSCDFYRADLADRIKHFIQLKIEKNEI